MAVPHCIKWTVFILSYTRSPPNIIKFYYANLVEHVCVVSDYDCAVVSEAAECNPEPNPNKKDIGFNINITT